MKDLSALALTDDQLTNACVLVVDDDQLVTSSLASFFMLEMDLEPRVFNEAPQALNYIREEEPDLIISDFLMPQLDGIKLLAEARKLHPEVPRILLTGYADKENAIRAINEVRLFQYIEKPWENDRLRIAVREGVERIYLWRMLVARIDEFADTDNDRDRLRAQLLKVFD